MGEKLDKIIVRKETVKLHHRSILLWATIVMLAMFLALRRLGDHRRGREGEGMGSEDGAGQAAGTLSSVAGQEERTCRSRVF